MFPSNETTVVHHSAIPVVRISVRIPCLSSVFFCAISNKFEILGGIYTSKKSNARLFSILRN